MQHSPRHLEGIAREILDIAGLDCPIDVCALAAVCGLTLKPWSRTYAEINLETGVIRYPAKVRNERVNFGIAHEIAHWVLRRAGESDDDERDVDYLASCLFLPRAAFLADLAGTDWDLFALKDRHPHASHQALSVRICQVSPASVSIWDDGHLHRAYGNHDTSGDLELVMQALASGAPVRGTPSAWPILERGHRRVVVVDRRAA